MGNYAYFAKDPGQWEESTQVLWGCHDICPSLTQFQVALVIWSELSALAPTGVWGDTEKFWGDMTFSSNSTWEDHWGGRWHLAWPWYGHTPYQTHLFSLDEVERKLALLLNSGDSWAYTFVQLNENTQHVSLSKVGHLSAIIDGMPSRNMCRCLCQLEVCKLLQYGDQVLYPEGLNGGFGAGANFAIRTTPLGLVCTWWLHSWTFIPTGGPLPGYTRRPYAQGPSSP